MRQSQYDDLTPFHLSIRDMLPDIVAHACQKDHLAFSAIYEYYRQPLGRRLMSLVQDHEVMLDLYQDTFVRAWKTISQKVADYFQPWLYTIAANLAIDYLRRKKLIDFQYLPENDECDRFAELSVEGDEDRICDLLFLQDAIELLSPQCHKCLVMQLHWGFSQREIAEKIGISESAVSAYVSRGRKQLNQHYAELESALQRVEAASDKYIIKLKELFLPSSQKESYPEWRLRRERIRNLLLHTGFPVELPPQLEQLWQEETHKSAQELMLQSPSRNILQSPSRKNRGDEAASQAETPEKESLRRQLMSEALTEPFEL